MSAIISTIVINDPIKDASSDPIRVMIVDDSVVVRGLVSRWVEEEPGMESVGKFSNGLKAVEQIATVKPDVVVLDIEMPVMDGLEALPKILKAVPGVKVIMASTLTQRNAEISLNALALGAADYVPKPVSNSGVTTSAEFRIDLIRKIHALGQNRKSRVSSRLATSVATKPISVAPASQPGSAIPAKSAGAVIPAKTYSLRPYSNVRPRVLVIGSSTGGPPALMTVLEELAPILKYVPVLITQHMPKTFTGIFAGHLGRAAGIPSAEGIDGEAVNPGRIYVAPGGQHMIVERKGALPIIRLTDDPEVNFCKPAVDPLFASVSKCYGASTLSVILTGMGADGANGAVIIADAGGSVVAQDEETSVVWGMPGASVKAGACSEILPLNKIAAKLKQLITGQVI